MLFERHWYGDGLSGMTLAIHRERSEDGFVVRLVGEFDPRMAGAITQAILSTAEPSVLLDVSDLRSLDGSGVRAIAEARDRLACQGKALHVLGADDDVVAAISLSSPTEVAGEPPGIEPDAIKQRRRIRQK
ncbi:MAG: STAS domain-containing protein [Acidimicrobiales bacterium]